LNETTPPARAYELSLPLFPIAIEERVTGRRISRHAALNVGFGHLAAHGPVVNDSQASCAEHDADRRGRHVVAGVVEQLACQTAHE